MTGIMARIFEGSLKNGRDHDSSNGRRTYVAPKNGAATRLGDRVVKGMRRAYKAAKGTAVHKRATADGVGPEFEPEEEVAEGNGGWDLGAHAHLAGHCPGRLILGLLPVPLRERHRRGEGLAAQGRR